jgi:hypothetical protein
MSIFQMGFLRLHKTVQIKIIKARRVTWERIARMVNMRSVFLS